MTKSEVMKEFLRKTVLPVILALLLFSIFSRIFTENGTTDYFLVWLACGVPFGIGKMFTLIPIGMGIPCLPEQQANIPGNAPAQR